MLLFALLLAAGYLAYLIWEKRTNDRCLATFRCVIHVNGIRGKTSVCRLIDAHLRGAGIRVFTKTTGTAAAYIDTAGRERPVRRWGGANILEQLSIIRRASREGAEVLILECMAVQPALQAAAQDQIVKAPVGVITNVRWDHLLEMGETLEDIAESLAGTIPAGGVLFTADETYFPFFQARCAQKGAQAVLCRPEEYGGENEAIAAAVGRHLGVPAEDLPAHIQLVRQDFGARHIYQVGETTLLNLFSANDPQSTRTLLRSYAGDEEDVTILYNNRADRPDRLLIFIRQFFPEVPCRKIVVMGENRTLARRLLRRAGYDQVELARNWRAALAAAEGKLLVGVGNIKGEAWEMLTCLEKGDGNE